MKINTDGEISSLALINSYIIAGITDGKIKILFTNPTDLLNF